MDTTQIPFLIQLLEDSSASVREHVTRELLAYGPGLDELLRSVEPVLDEQGRRAMRRLLAVQKNLNQRREAWRAWPHVPAERERLETALDLIAQFQYEWTPPVRLPALLGELTQGFMESGYAQDPRGLARFLFEELEFTGCIEDYYSPLNSNLIYVLQERRGIPITLATVFILVGQRAGLDIWGVNMPGHFLTAAPSPAGVMYFDCFNRGRCLTKTDMRRIRASIAPDALLDDRAPVEAIVGRVLRNLIHAYQMAEDLPRAQLTRQLLHELEVMTPA